MMNRLLTCFYVVAWVLLAVWASHASTRALSLPPRSIARERIDQVAVIRGSIIPARSGILGKEDDMYTNIAFQPYGRALFAEESVLFCGYEGDRFNGMSGPIEVRFDARAHRTYQGVACYTLLSVRHWTPPEQRGW